VTAAFSVCCFS